MKRTALIAASLAILAAAACTKTEIKEVEVEKEVEKVVDLLTLNATQFQVSNEGVTQPLSFTTEDAWTITTDQNWVSFDNTSGNAGNATVNMTVAKNETTDTRTARVVLSVSHGTNGKATTFTIVQSDEKVFSSTIRQKINFSEQDITIEYNSNLTPEVKVVEGDWLSVVQTKAAPVDGAIVVHATKNDDLDARTGSFTVAAGSFLQTYVVVQASQYAAASSATAYYLANVQDMYDTETYTFKQYNQFAVLFSTPDGDVTLALNADPELSDITKIPAGEYKIDDAGTRAAGTFSVRNQNEKYYTSVVANGNDIDIIDGTITVSQKGSEVSIVASLVDILGAERLYSFQGELSVTDASFGAQAAVPEFNNNYNTYFATGANEWKQTIYLNKAADDKLPWLNQLYLTIYGPAGDVTDTSLPTGTFNYAVAETIDTGHPKGSVNAAVGSFTIGGSNIEGSADVSVPEDEKLALTIAKDEDGRYSYTFKGKIQVKVRALDEDGWWATDDDWNYIYASEEVYDVDFTAKDTYVPASSESIFKPVLDGDGVFTSGGFLNPVYSGQFYGDPLGTGSNIMTLGWGSINEEYTVFLTFDLGPNYVFNPTLRNRYSQEAIPNGTYSYSDTVVEGKTSLLPGYYLAASRCYIQNQYTGTVYYLTGGSITFANGTPTFNLEGTSRKGEKAKFTGSFATGVNVLDGNYRNAAYQARFSLKPFTL